MKRTIMLAVILAGIGVLSVAVVAAQAEPTDEEIRKTSLTPGDIPEEARKRANPYRADAASLEHGKMIFSSQCTMCHGADGAGTGDLVERLSLDMPDFTDSKWQSGWTDGSLFYVVSNGHGEMPGQAKRFRTSACGIWSTTCVLSRGSPQAA